MVNKKRYQIFVSSTFADLKEERKMVMQAILERKGFPAGMELFPAKDKRQFDYIKQVIDDSDYYLLIIGARYGSLDDDGVSYTEKEYDYAVSKEIPVIAFLHSDIRSIPLGKADDDKELRLKLEAFRTKVQTGRLVNYWENAHDLKAKVVSSLVDAFEDQDRPRIGWVRANWVVNDDSQKEIDRLTKEIIKHQNEVKRLEGVLNLKEEDRLELDYYYKAAQKEINNLEDQVKTLETKLEKLNTSPMTILKKPQSKTEVITIPWTDVSFKMVHVDGGTFRMGANDDDKEAFPNERPAHEVTLSDYWIGETQVTWELWEAVMGSPIRFDGEQDLPVDRVSWINCQRFIERLNEKTSRNFHLPTEAQWEFAARGGNLGKESGYKYSGRSDSLETIAWYDKNSGGKTHPVAKLCPNQLGLYDMLGNVFEWCQDEYDYKYYRVSSKYDPINSTSNNLLANRVRRGGCCKDIKKICRVSRRGHSRPEFSSYGLGLRLAL